MVYTHGLTPRTSASSLDTRYDHEPLRRPIRRHHASNYLAPVSSHTIVYTLSAKQFHSQGWWLDA
jgi:hypothetical protein